MTRKVPRKEIKQSLRTKGQYEKHTYNPRSWIRRYSIDYITILPKMIFIFNVIVIKHQLFSVDVLQKLIILSKINMEIQEIQGSQNDLEGRKSWRIHTLQFQYLLLRYSD